MCGLIIGTREGYLIGSSLGIQLVSIPGMALFNPIGSMVSSIYHITCCGHIIGACNIL